MTVNGTALSTSDYTVSGMNITIPANKITGNVVITVATEKVNTQPDTPTMYTFTINPTPSTATVTLTASGYAQSGNSITVPSGTSVAWKVEASGYVTQNGTHTVTKTETKNVTLVQNSNSHLNVSFITRTTNNINIVNDKSVGTTGGYNDDQNYLSYEYTIPYDGTIYFDSSVSAIYIALWHSGTNTRYRKSENNLPTQDNPLTVTAGDKIISTLTKATATSFKLVYNNEVGSTYTEQLIVSKSDMILHENQTAGANGISTNESYNSWELDFSGKAFERGYLYMSDFATYYTALLILSENGNVRYRINTSEDTLPKDISTIVPITSNDTIYVSESKSYPSDFKIHFITEN